MRVAPAVFRQRQFEPIRAGYSAVTVFLRFKITPLAVISGKLKVAGTALVGLLQRRHLTFQDVKCQERKQKEQDDRHPLPTLSAKQMHPTPSSVNKTR